MSNGSGNVNVNMLFYSKECPTCVNLLTVLQNEYLIGYLKLICVDDYQLHQLPPMIKTVPTMIVSNANKPLVAKECFDWVNQMKFLRQNQQLQNMKNKMIQNAIMNSMTQKDEPIKYNKQEMDGVSDTFSLLDKDIAFRRNYVGTDENIAIFTAPDTGKISKEETRNRISQTENDRKQQDAEYKKLQKEQQLNAVMRAEQKKFERRM